MFWERFYNLCLEKGTKPNPVAKALGISSGIVTKWKTLGTLPNGDTLTKLADYLGCSVDYLLGRTEEKEKPTAPEGDELDELLKDPETREFYELIKDFSDDELEDLLNYGQDLIAKRDSKEKP